MERAFLKALKAGSVDLAQYGDIVFSGDGDGPPEVIRELIATRFSE